MKLRAIIWLLFLISTVFQTKAQDSLAGMPPGNLRRKTVSLHSVSPGDTLQIDRASIDVSTFYIQGISDTCYILLPLQGKMVWRYAPAPQEVTLHYRVLAVNFNTPYFRKELNGVDSNIAAPMFSLSGQQYTSFKGFVDFNALDYQGAYARSLSIGNNQDVALNSNFNLQLNGYIMDSIRIEAAITDNTIPFQPDGNTYQIQEFDRLYITFEKNKHRLTAGDFNIATPHQSYFLQFNKRVQGLWVQSEDKLHSGITNKVSFNGSIAKGQYSRNIFNGQEGNQGPYKLTGNNGEQYFIVLAGTERVFIDGILLERGEDRDYVINYNTAEIKFMPRQMITKDKRIQIEFEYQDRNYLNSLFHFNDEVKIGKKFQLRVNAYSNQDAKNLPYLANFSDEQKQFLASIGDNINEAFYRSMNIDTTTGSNGIRYRMARIDANGQVYDSVFIYSNNRDSTLYNLSFSYVGENKGNYIISSLNTNGRSYEWVAPQNGIPQGQFEPVILLITPKQHQVFSLGATYQLDSSRVLLVEAATSKYDPNLYAATGSKGHWGYATKFNYSDTRHPGKRDSTGRVKWSWNNQVNYEYVSSDFRAIAPYRNVEFNRDWSVDSSLPRQDEHLLTFQSWLKKSQSLGLRYNLTYFKNGSYFDAFRNIAALDWDHRFLRANLTFNMMNAEAAGFHTRYLRPQGFVEHRFKKVLNLTLGTSYELEENDSRSRDNNLFRPNAFKFDVFSIYLKNDDAAAIRLQLRYFTRADFAADSTRFVKDSRSQNIEWKAGLYQWDNHQVNLTGGYRFLNVLNPANTTLKPEGSVVGRVEYQGTLWNKLATTTLVYELGTGQEQKREYTYIEVDAGLGMFMWVDYNGDGIQQANEFELAVFNDQKRFIRTLTLTNEYVNVDYASLNYSLMLQPEQLWNTRTKGIRGFLGRFSNQLSLQLSNRAMEGLGLQAFNIFNMQLPESLIIQQSQNIINTLFFNRSSTKFGADYVYIQNAGKTLLTYGVESNQTAQHTGKVRWGISRILTLNLKGIEGRRRYYSGLDDGRTYDISIRGVEPSLVTMFSTRLRLTLSYNNETRSNKPEMGPEKASIRTANMDLRWSMPTSGVVQARFTYANIHYNGEANTSVAFSMLDALSKGQNFLWGLGWDSRIAKGIELSLEYEGRKPGANRMIHTGRMSIRALL